MAETDKFLLLSNVDDIREAADEVYLAKEDAITGIEVNGAALAIAEGICNILIQTGTADGSIKVNGTDVNVAGLAALAYKSEVSASDLATALKNAIDGKAEASALNAIIGSDTGKTIRAISAEEVAKIVAGADASYDTLKEIADWIMSDTTGAAKMQSDIAALSTKLTLGNDGSGSEYATVRAYVEAVVAGLNLDDYVQKEAGKGLSTNDYTTAEKNKLAGVAAGAQVNVIESITVNGTAASISGKAATVTLPTATSAEVKARFAAAGN